jgi:hypothetical protein
MLSCNSSSSVFNIGQAAILIGSQRDSFPAVAHRLAENFIGATVEEKTCNECFEPKEHSEFYSDAAKADGLSTRCKVCILAAAALYRETHRAILRANAKRDREACPERGVWHQIISRCTNPKNPAYHNYGERGITVWPEWIRSFEAFYRRIK